MTPIYSLSKAVGDRVELSFTAPADWPVVGTGLTGFSPRGYVTTEDGQTLLDLSSVTEPISISGQVITLTLTGDVPGDGVSGETRRLGVGKYLIGVRVANSTDVIAVVEIRLELTAFPAP